MVRIGYEAQRIFQGVRFKLTRRLPTRDPAAVFPGIEDALIEHQPLTGRFGNVKPHELALLCAAVRWARPRALFEFGTFDGRTAWHLARNAGPEARLWTLDLPPDHPSRTDPAHDRSIGKVYGVEVDARLRGTPEADQVTHLFGDSLEFDPAPYEGLIDFCFIDAGHGEAHVRADTANALRMVRPGGLIFWHDYSRWWPGVQRCLDELSREWPVFRAANTSLGVLQIPGH
jgi:predicted O-methyltransferase YrrM